MLALLADVCFAGTALATTDPVAVLVAESARQLLLDKIKQSGLSAPVVDATVLPNPRPMAACREHLAVEAVDTRFPMHMRFAVVCPDSNARKEYVVRAQASAEVVVTSAVLAAEQMLEAQDVTLERRDVTAIPDAISDPRLVIGLAYRRGLRVGQVVQKQGLIPPILLRRGESVTISAVNGPIEVSVAGEALELGRRGDVIKVRNVATGKIIRARVTDKGTVEPADQVNDMSAQSPD
jgi:flagella basal body P-ring formation protein FlgA